MPPTCHPRHAALLGAVPTDPTLLGRKRKRHWQEGGTHRIVSLVSAESELGTLPVRILLSRSLHTRGGSGCSGVLRRTHGSDVPLTVPAHRTHRRGCPLSTPQSHGVQGSPLRAPQEALLPQHPGSMPPTCIPRHAARSEQSRPIRPSSAARAARRGTHSCTRLVSAESELGKLPVSLLLLRPLHTPKRTRPLRRYYAAPTATMCPYGTRALYPWEWVPLEYSLVTSRNRGPV